MKTKEWVILGIISLVLCFVNIWGHPIYILDEAKNAACAAEMFRNNEWIIPTFNGDLRTDKPVLHYYFMKAGYALFGVNALGARFFSALAGLGTILLVYFFTRKNAGHAAALWSAISLAAAPHFILEFHLAVPDPYLIFFLSLAVYSFFEGIRLDQSKWIALAFGAAALGALAKGPVAPGLVGLIFLVYFLASKQLSWDTIKKLRLHWGIPLFLLIALPWYVLVDRATGGAWTEGFFFKHNLERFSGEMEGHGGFVGLPILFIIVGMLPFAVFLPQMLRFLRKQKNNWLRLNAIAALSIGIFFSISATKLPNYTIPAYPFLAVLLGGTIAHLLEKRPQSIRVNLWVLLVLALGIIIGGYFGVKGDRVMKNDPELIFYLLGIPLVCGVALFLFFQKKYKASLFSIAGGFMMGTLALFIFIFPKLEKLNPVTQALPLLEETKEIAHYRFMNRAFVFNTGREIPKLESLVEVAAFFDENPNGILISYDKYSHSLDSLPNLEVIFKQKDLFETRTTVIWKKE